jgi:hypothetical protein
MSDAAVLAKAQSLLDGAIDAQRYRLKGYERPSELLALETLRAIDNVYCLELFPKAERGKGLHPGERHIMSWGVNGALLRILPEKLHLGPFKTFSSNSSTQEQADGFLFDCGLLSLAERQQGLVREGLLLPTIDGRQAEGMDILVLTAADPSLYSEAVGWDGQRWISAEAMQADRETEGELEARHRSMLPTLEAQITSAGSGQSEAMSRELDRYFHQWAQIYLRRMPYRDVIDGEERIGGRRFGDYLAALEALSALAQMRLCYAGLLKHKDRRLDLRNFITGASPYNELVEAVASFLDADAQDVEQLLGHLILGPDNRAIHLQRADTAWAPAVRTSVGTCLLPAYGLDINPFLFLLNDVRWKYEKDWFRAANARESRWIAELLPLFPAPRWQCTRRGVNLKRGSEVVTDIDFAAYDNETGEMALLQLKWQQPVAADHKIRRSTGRNLLHEGNRWVADVFSWVAEFGHEELARRLGFAVRAAPSSQVFVLARYGAHFSGYAGLDERAVWADWAHFAKVRKRDDQASVLRLAQQVSTEIDAVRDKIALESLALALPGLAVVVNPSRSPPRSGWPLTPHRIDVK